MKHRSLNKSAIVHSIILRGFFFKENWLSKIKSSVVVNNYSGHFLKCMIIKTVLQYKCCKTVHIALSFVACL